MPVTRRTWRHRGGGLAVLAVGLLPLAACEPKESVTFVVDSTADAVDADPADGSCQTSAAACTLRAAIMEANARGDRYSTIVVLAPAASYSFGLIGPGEDGGASGDLDVRADIRVEGHGATVYGSWNDRVIEHHHGSLTLVDLHLVGGSADLGGGILNRSRLAATNVTISNSESSGAGGTALHQVSGSTNLDRVTIEGGRSSAIASTLTGAVYVASGGLVLQRSTVSENFGHACDLSGGELPIGVWCRTSEPTVTAPPPFSAPAGLMNAGGTVLVFSSTVSTNKGSVGSVQCINFPVPRCFGVVYRVDGDGIRTTAGTTQIYRSTILGNSIGLSGPGAVEAAGSVITSCTAPVVSGGYNIDGNASCFTGATPTDVGAGALWIDAVLADNGGPTRTHLPYFAPVVNAIPDGTAKLCDGTLPTDQRGSPQAVGGRCDRGSVEA